MVEPRHEEKKSWDYSNEKFFSLTKSVFMAFCSKMNVVMGSSGKKLGLLLSFGRREEDN